MRPFPNRLLESELFGYVGGGLTRGRREGKTGLFEVAREGSVFWTKSEKRRLGSSDNRRVIQETLVRRIGGSKVLPIETLNITATDRNLEQLVGEAIFRQDLYYRINVLPIHFRRW